MIVIDEDKVIVREAGMEESAFGIGTPEAFRILSRLWIRSGWDTKYVYGFTWLGRPIIQLPEDMIRMQEVIYSVQPDLIVETGVAHGGSLCFYASICQSIGKGRVVGVDIGIRSHNRQAIESRFLAPYISLIEGNSIDARVVSAVRERIPQGGRALVVLDSCHTKDHVRAELEAYSPMVAPGSYIVAMDGVMELLAGAPRTLPDWRWNNPRQAAREFAAAHPEFEIAEPPFLFNEGQIAERVTYCPGAFLRRTLPQADRQG
jgi:cephalosporin hydroxylase